MNEPDLSAAFCILGVDPGLSGAIAFYFPDYPDRISVEDMPVVDGRIDAASLSNSIRVMSPDMALVESVGAMPGQGVSSTFKFGVSFGAVLGILGAIEIPYYLVSAQRWKKHFRLDADKEKARAEALRLWPSRHDLFARKKDHGRAEAALIARYGAETLPSRKAKQVA